MNNKSVLAFLGFLAALAFALPAMAQKSDSAFYAGAAFGKSHASRFCDSAGPTCQDQQQTWKVMGGYQFNRYLALEGAFQSLGSPSDTTTGNDFKAQDIEVVGIASYPLAWDFAAYGKFGFYHARMRGSNAGASYNEKNYDVTYGIGVQWNYLDPVGIRAEVQRYPRMGGGSAGFQTDYYVWSIGAIYLFK